MNSLDELGIPNRAVGGQSNILDLHGIPNRPITQSEPEGDSWGDFLRKSVIKTTSELPDIPANVLHLAERGGRKALGFFREQAGKPNNIDLGAENDFFSPENVDRPSKWFKTGADKLGLDVTPRPSDGAQRIAGHAIDVAVPMALFGLGGGLSNILKQAGTGTAIGGTSGVLQEAGVNPLAADLVSIFGLPSAARAISNTGRAAGNLLGNFTKAGQEKKIQEAASDVLRNKVGEQNINKVLENLEAPTPFGADLNTAERAQNTGISSLHRVFAPNLPGSAAAEREAVIDGIIRNKLNELAPQITSEVPDKGRIIREYLDNELKNLSSNRSATADPLYDKAYSLRYGVDLPKFKEYIKEEGRFAKGDIADAFDFLEESVKKSRRNQEAPKLSLGGKEAVDFDSLPIHVQQKLKNQLGDVGFETRPIPPELTEAVKAINSKIGSTKSPEVRRVLTRGRERLLEDMVVVPEEKIARETYAKLSKEIDPFENQELLKTIIQKKKKDKKAYKLSPEEVPAEILKGSLDDLSSLSSIVKKDKKALDTVRGSFLQKLIKNSELAAKNANTEPALSPYQFNEFLENNRGRLKHFFDKEQIEVLDNVNDILSRRSAVATMGREIGSPTQARLTLLDTLTDPVKKSLFKKFLYQIPGGKYLSPAIEGAKNYEKQQITSLLEQALLDPNTAKKLLTPLDQIKSKESLKSILGKRTPLAIYSASKQKNERDK